MAHPFVCNLDTTLLQLSPHDRFTLRDAMNGGVHIWGAPGSAKSSGSGQALAGAYLRANMGGLWLAAKPEEVELARDSAKRHGRENSVIVFDDTRSFNFISYELARHGTEGISNVVESVMHVLETADQITGVTGSASDPFWPQSMRQVLSHVVPVVYAAYGEVTVGNIVEFAVTAATDAEKYQNPDFDSYAARTLRNMVDRPKVAMLDDRKRACLNFWFYEWPGMAEKTRSNIVTSLSAKLDRFRHGRLQKCFSSTTDTPPELCFQGAIIIMAMPVNSWNDDGLIGQRIFLYHWQRAMQSRNALPVEQRERPVFLWADESQYFASPRDDEFLSTCRSAYVCPVFISQNLPSYYARFGKEKTDAVDGLVGKFQTQIFHLNGCARTNEYASKNIGRAPVKRRSASQSHGTNRSRGMNAGANNSAGQSSGFGTSSGEKSHSFSHNSGSNSSSGNSWGDNVGTGTSENTTDGYAEQNDFIVEPRFFATALQTGGPENDFLVTAVWFKAGGNFKDGDGGNFLITTFRQRP